MLNRLITPRTVAVIGASSHSEKVGHQILKNIIAGGFQGEIYPVNPKGGEILGLPASIELAEIHAEIDLAVIAIPAALVEGTVRECAAHGVKAVIIISAGFAETGAEGVAEQERIARVCHDHDILLLGPNCLGLINTNVNLNATFARAMPKKGHVSFFSQSGATITSLADWSLTSSIGFSKIFSLGDKALLHEADILEFLYKDPETQVIIGYLENLVIDRKLSQILRTYATTKPTVMLFGGKSDYGRRAAQSHTGSLISSYRSIKTYLLQAGVTVAETLEDFLLYAKMFSYYSQIAGNRFAIVTNAGGLGVVTSDEIAELGLSLPALSEKTQRHLRDQLRGEANVVNPIDVLGDASRKEYQAAMEATAEDPSVDGIITLLTPQSATDIEGITDEIISHQGKKPMINVFIGGDSFQKARRRLEEAGRLCFNFPEEATRAARALASRGETHAELLETPLINERKYDPEKKESILKEFNLPVLEYAKAKNMSELTKRAAAIGFPLVLKTDDPAVVHKSDAGGVKLGIKNKTELARAYKELGGGPVAVGKMIRGEREIFVGAKKDSQTGTIIAFGYGGIFAEIIDDFSYRFAPFSRRAALEMIGETKMGRILSGARGQKKYDLEKLAELIENTARFVLSFTNVSEVDFNPVLAAEDGYHIVDARIVIKE